MGRKLNGNIRKRIVQLARPIARCIQLGFSSTPKTPAIATATANVSSGHEGKGNPSDYVFEGDPYPDMDPLDEEAEVISESLQEKWRHPIDTLPAPTAA